MTVNKKNESPKKKELIHSRKRFVEEFVVDLNATKAAERSGYSKKTARSIGSELLTFPDVREAIAEEMKKRSERTGITADMVLKELARLGFSNMSDYGKWGESGVTLTDSDTLTEEQTACVSEVSETTTKEGGTIKFKLHDKRASLELLGRHLGIFEKDNTQRGAVIIYNTQDVNIPDDAGVSK